MHVTFPRNERAMFAAPGAPLDVATRAGQPRFPAEDATERSSVRAWCDAARGSSVTSRRKSQVSDDNAQARMTATSIIVGYMHGPGSEILRDTLGHATAIADELNASGLLIDPGHQVAITPERLNELKHDEATLDALHAAGVDNWEGYDDALAALHVDDVAE